MNKDGQGFLYKQLAAEIEDKIAQGTFRAGDRLPSIRRLHRQLNLSLSTVYQAYVELETLGLVEARPKSGYYVRPAGLDRIPAPTSQHALTRPQKVNLTSMISSIIAAAGDRRLIPLGASALSREILPYRHFSRILKGVTAEKMKSLLAYSLTEGDRELRRHLARLAVGLVEGVSPDDFIVTNGCTEAISLSLQALVRPGDVVVIESPTHFGFLQLLWEMRVLVVEAPTDPRHGVDLGELDSILKKHKVKACLFMPNFHNPLGALMPDDKKEELVKLLNRREVPVIEDDLYAELFFEGSRPTLLKSFDRKDLVITCSSFSKSLAPGPRVGWVLPGPRFREKIQGLKAGTTISVSSLDQYVIERFLAEGAYDRYMRSLRNAIRGQVIQTALAVQRYFPAGVRLAVPRGGLLLWVELPPKVDGMELYYQALENNISIIPGSICSGSQRYRNYIRLGCGSPFSQDIENGIKVLGDLVKDAAG